MGDYNYRDVNWENNTSGSLGKKFLKIINNASLTQCVNDKTRGENILDLIFVYESNLINNIQTLAPVAKSDHSCLKISLNLQSEIVPKIIKCYNYKTGNYDRLAEDFEEQKWEDITAKNSVNDTWNIMVDKLRVYRDKNVPNYIRNATDDAPWINNTIKKAIKKRNNMYKRFKKYCLSYLKVKYIRLRNEVVKLIKKAKTKYEAKIIRKSRNNRKCFYSYIASKNNRQSRSKIGPFIDNVGRVILKDKEVAQSLNTYFVSVFNKEKSIEEFNITTVDSSQQFTLDEIIFNSTNIEKTIAGFKPYKSPGIDSITSTYALEIKGIISKPLEYLFNSSLQSSSIPND